MREYCTVQELLTVNPVFQAMVVAGWVGRNKRIFQVMASLSDELNGNLEGRVVLVGTDEAGQADIQDMLHGYCNLSPAAILLSGYTTAPSQRVIDAADKNAVPLLICRRKITVIELQNVLELTADLVQEGRITGYAEQYRLRQLADLKLELPGLLDKLAEYLRNPVIVVDAAFQTMARGGSERLAPAGNLGAWVTSARFQILQRKKNGQFSEVAYQQQLDVPGTDKINCYIAPLALEGRLLGYLLSFAALAEFNELDLLRIRETGVSCLQLLICRRNVEEIEKKYKEHFLYDLLYNNFDSEDALIKRAQYWGWEFSKPHWLLVVEADDFKQLSDKAEIMETVLLSVAACLKSRYRYAICSNMRDQIVIIIPGSDSDGKSIKHHLHNLANVLQTEIRDLYPKLTFSIGIGKQYPAISDLCRSYQEAKHALDLGRFIQEKSHITHFEDLGIIRLLSHVSLDQLNDFYKEHLAAILEYDEKNNTNFLETLQVYFQQNGDLNLMAEKLFMHANTVRYRLKKIEELLDTDLQKIENRVIFSVACKIAKMRETNY